MTVRKGYRPVAYHNWSHAFAVAHSMGVIMKVASEVFTWEEVYLTAVVITLCFVLEFTVLLLFINLVCPEQDLC